MPVPKPRDAATLILVRRDGSQPRILMGRRSAGHTFMPRSWVFPGGSVDRTDYRSRFVQDLRPEVAADLAASARLKRQNAERLARAIAVAALRETLEETGLVLGQMANKSFIPDLGGVDYVARAITPPARHKRFDARFLMADAEHLASLEPQDSRELEEVGWFNLKECRELDLPLVTRAVLEVVEQRLEGKSPERPFWRWTRNGSGTAL